MSDWLIVLGSLVGVLILYEGLRAAARALWQHIKHKRRKRRGVYY